MDFVLNSRLEGRQTMYCKNIVLNFVFFILNLNLSFFRLMAAEYLR
jgi:hypothetical protein